MHDVPASLFGLIFTFWVKEKKRMQFSLGIDNMCFSFMFNNTKSRQDSMILKEVILDTPKCHHSTLVTLSWRKGFDMEVRYSQRYPSCILKVFSCHLIIVSNSSSGNQITKCLLSSVIVMLCYSVFGFVVFSCDFTAQPWTTARK